jgi:outer membrane protein
MIKHIVLITIAVLCILFSTKVAAQGWTLEQCIQYALDNNVTIQQQELTAEQRGNQLFQSKMEFIPSLGIRMSDNLSWGMSRTMRPLDDGGFIEVQEDRFSHSFIPSISASINLFEGLKKIYTLRRSQSDYDAAKQDVELLKNEISLNVTQAYLQVLLSNEMLTVAESSYESLEVQLTRLKQLVEAGSRPYSEQLEMEAQLASEEVQRVTSKNQLENNYLTLHQLLNFPVNSKLQIAKPDLAITKDIFNSEDITDVYTQALNLPQIRGAEYRMESAHHALGVSRGGYWPTLSLTGSFGSSFSNSIKDNFWDQITDNKSPAIGFSLNIPIFTNWSVRTNVKNAKLNHRIAELEVENKRKTLYKEIQTASTDALAAFNKYKASERNVIASKESFRYVETKFETGLLNATDYNMAKNNLLKAQSEELQSKYQYIFQLKILDFYKGIPIKL